MVHCQFQTNSFFDMESLFHLSQSGFLKVFEQLHLMFYFLPIANQLMVFCMILV